MATFPQEHSTSIRDLSPETLNLARGLVELQKFYPSDVNGVSLKSLPILNKSHFRLVKDSLLKRARKQPAGTVVLGSGGTTSKPIISVIPSRMFLDQICRVWAPLSSHDVVMNLNTGSELGSMFPFFNALAHASDAIVVPLGPLGDHEAVERWLPFFDAVGATTLAGTPTQISIVLRLLNDTSRRIPSLNKLIWTGEAFSPDALEQIKRYGGLDMFGAYGSTETWVIGVSCPNCDIGTFHRVPHQHVEFIDEQVTVTCLDNSCINPIVRYQPGDYGQIVDCACGRTGAFSIKGRADEQIKFLSILFYPQEPFKVVSNHPDVRAAQVILIDSGSPHERMEVHVVLNHRSDVGRQESISKSVRALLLGKLYRLAHEANDRPERITVKVVDQLGTNPRSMKTPYIVYRTSSRDEEN